MLDQKIRPVIDPLLARAGRWLASLGITADAVTLAGCAFGLAAALCIASDMFALALGLFLGGRIVDGLDGAVARATRTTDRGGYLDIVLDFAVYAAIPLAFAAVDPTRNALPAAAMLAAIVLNGSAFLAFAIMAQRRGLTTAAQGEKSLYFLSGLAEGTETIAVYAACCLWPHAFPMLAYGFAALCLVSGIARIVMAWRILRD